VQCYIKNNFKLPQKKIVIKMQQLVEFTGVPVENVYDTLVYLPVNDIQNLCITHRVLDYICSDEEFWRNYINKNYPPRDYGFINWQRNVLDELELPQGKN
jgi:hypothetical protein